MSFLPDLVHRSPAWFCVNQPSYKMLIRGVLIKNNSDLKLGHAATKDANQLLFMFIRNARPLKFFGKSRVKL